MEQELQYQPEEILRDLEREFEEFLLLSPEAKQSRLNILGNYCEQLIFSGCDSFMRTLIASFMSFNREMTTYTDINSDALKALMAQGNLQAIKSQMKHG